MQIAVTGATGFIGRYIVNRLVTAGHRCHCWHRPNSDRTGFDGDASALRWSLGQLNDPRSFRPLIEGCDAVVHAALDRPGKGFRGAEGDVARFVETNVLGTIRLIESCAAGGRTAIYFCLNLCGA